MVKKVKRHKAKYVRYCVYCGRGFKAKMPGAKFCCASHRSSYSKGYSVLGVDSTEMELRNIEARMVEDIGPTKGDIVKIEFKKTLLDFIRKQFHDMLICFRNNDVEGLEEIKRRLGMIVPDD